MGREKSCSIPNCPFEGIPGRSFHEFPSNEIMRKKWLRKIKSYSGITLDLSRLTRALLVCGGHFEKECFRITKNSVRRLKADSIPTIFTSESDRCAAKNCTSTTNNGTKLFRFPSNEKMRSNWTKICKRSDSWTPTNSSRLCSLHFSEDQFKRSRADGSTKLKANALPTISVEDIRDKNESSNCIFLPDNLDESVVINDVTFISTSDNDDKVKECDETSFLDSPVIEVQNGIYDTEKSIADASPMKLGNERSEEIIIKIQPDHDESLVEKYELLKQEHDDLKRKYETLQKLYTEERGKIALLMLLVESGRCSNDQLQDILKSKN